MLVTTFREDGTGWRTPGWVGREGGGLGIGTGTECWKGRRIRNRADVRVGPCDVRGNRNGEHVPAVGEICPPEGTAAYRALLRQKYGLVGVLTVLGSRRRRGEQGTAGIRIT
ncbi:PPOX class F420-dependent oxidoreductase, partial [Saccharothrix sp. ST-888]|uniref:PPOX class F420-dependent oxidoreductase n=1 Tax=Saccharothrix sp. ST-888 TaxID=1427391 RepID=UPI0005EC06F1